MALETVVYPQNCFLYAINSDLYNLLGGGGSWSYQDFNLQETEEDGLICCDFLNDQTENYPYGEWEFSPSTIPYLNGDNLSHASSDSVNPNPNGSTQTPSCNLSNLDASTAAIPAARSKRRRARSRKNKEEIENQRMTHIAVERNRRKQMNEYLSLLRSLMPESYIQRNDQASIIGGAINFVKELEQSLQFLVSRKEKVDGKPTRGQAMPFCEFFAFPQYSTNPSAACENPSSMGDKVGQRGSAIADIEVTMMESHANLKIRLTRRPNQLVNIVSGLHSLRLTVLHLNLTTNIDTVLYSFTLKVEADAKLGSADEIAAAVYKLLNGIHQETASH